MENVKITVDPNSLEEQAILEAEKAKPSTEPSYWAKRSCNTCHGRGIEGVVTVTLKNNNKMVNSKMCACAQSRFARWRYNFIADWLKANNSK